MSGSAITSPTQLGENWSDLIAGGNIPEQLRQKGMDELGKLAYIFKGQTKFMHMLHTRFPKAKTVSDREHKIIEIRELDRVFNISVASQDTNHKQFGVTNSQAKQLQVQDTLLRKGVYTYPVNETLSAGQVIPGGGTNVGNDLYANVGSQTTDVRFARSRGISGNYFFTDYETLLVTAIGDKDSAGTGNTLITVERCWHGPGAKDMGGGIINRAIVNSAVQAQSDDAAFLVEDTLIRMLPAWYEGTNAPNGIYKAPYLDMNFTQEFKYAVEQTTESKIPKTRMKEDLLTISKKLVGRRMLLDMERTYLFGRKGKQVDTDGREIYTMGGVVEHIPKDERHILTYQGSGINYPGLLDLGEKIFDLGGGTSRDCFVGPRLYTEIKKAFYNDNKLRFNPDYAKRFNIEVDTLYVTGGELNIIPLYSMGEAGYDTTMVCLDTSVPSYVPVTHPDWDMKVQKNIQEPGAQMYKEQTVGIKGLERRYPEYQSLVHFNLP